MSLSRFNLCEKIQVVWTKCVAADGSLLSGLGTYKHLKSLKQMLEKPFKNIIISTWWASKNVNLYKNI
jgi:hypothetical protein